MQTLAKTIDPSDHLPLIWRCIHQLGIRGTDAEEAFSEGLVAIVLAARTYNPDKGPLANWLARNISWELKTWRSKQRQETLPDWLNIGVQNNIMDAPSGEEIMGNIASRPETQATIRALEPSMTCRLEIQEALRLLDGEERLVIWAHALGYSGKEISKSLKVTQVQVSRIKKRAQQKLKQALPRIY